MKKLLILFLVVLVLAAILNPSEDNFKEHIGSELTTDSEDGLLDIVVKEGLKIQSNLTTDYKDKIFFSIAESDIADETHQYLGIFGIWIKIN